MRTLKLILLAPAGLLWAVTASFPAETNGFVSVVTRAERRVELSVRRDDQTNLVNYKVEVFLPPNYATETASYPVLYVFDGLDFRREHDALAEEGLIHPAILVAIHNLSDRARLYDLTPSADARAYAPSGGLPAFAQLIVGRIKPYVDAHFRTLDDAAHTGIAGNSLGGLAACWLGYNQPEVFGFAGCFEPALWWNDRELLKRLKNDTSPKTRTRFWIVAADQEYPSMWREAKHAAFALSRRGWIEGEDLVFYQVHNASHDWGAVRTQLRDTLHFFLRAAAPELINAELTICHGPQHAPIRLRESGEFSNAYLDLYFAGGFRATAIAPSLRVADTNVARIGDTVLGQLWPTGAGWTTVSSGYRGFQSSLAVQGFRLDGYPKLQLPVATTPITVDGNLSDWSDLPFGKTNGSSAGFRFGVSYDPDFVYVGVSVKDDKWVALPKLDDPPNQDAIEILLDARPDPLRSLGKGVERFFDFICIQMAPGESADSMKLRRRKEGFPAIPEGLRAICLRNADGYTAEVAIPAAALDRAQERPWQEFRLNVAQYDLDETNGKVHVIWWQPDWRSDSNLVASGTFSRSGEPSIRPSQWTSAADTNGLYLGQKPPGKTPELFAPGIVSKKNSKEHCLAVSPKGDEMFFTTGSGWPHSKIMHVKKLGDNWSPAEPAAFLKDDWATQPAFSPNGRYLYFSSSRGKSDIRLYSIWRCKKTGDGWSEPENVISMSGDLIMEFHPSVDRDGSMYFLRWDFPNQTGDLYVARAEGDKLAEPVKLNAPISTEFNEVRPTVDPLGRYLLFVSDRPGGCGGDDVYVCIRNADGTWSAPRNLGPEWNTAGDDDVPTISPDGRYWFFEKNNDIYWKEAPAFPIAGTPPRPVSSSTNPASKSE